MISGNPEDSLLVRLLMIGSGDSTRTNLVRKARLAGALYLLTIILGMFAAFVGNPSYGRPALLIGTVAYGGVTVLLYLIFKPVNPALSLIAAAFSLAGCAISILETAHIYQAPFNSLVLFGFYCLMLAWLSLRSEFTPRVLGWLLAVAGVGWLTYIVPPLARQLVYATMAAGLIGEGSLTVWLLMGSMRPRPRTEHPPA
jgi:Domain of unknown function (DUF4386)